MKPVSVIAVGSPYGADNIGSIVIEKLRQKLIKQTYCQQIELAYYDRPGFYLLELMQAAKMIHLIDTVVSDEPVGTIQHYQDIKFFQRSNQVFSSHAYGVTDIIQLAEALNLLPEKLIIHTIDIKIHQQPNPLSEELLAACHRLARQISRKLSDLFANSVK